ncbi:MULTISPECIES: hypothetical protein [Bacillaceae]|uniref:PepSY domain-containing protein n=1 Tax=Domibacillus aminovorans TaxID=29332 RepID=A0A177KYA7_9BACI|nr:MULTISPECIES: hypothetical protein [Bacillaceae]OAH57985.1 hypothetical protein AWH48_02985 [Domibacillus aminovorans]
MSKMSGKCILSLLSFLLVFSHFPSDRSIDASSNEVNQLDQQEFNELKHKRIIGKNIPYEALIDGFDEEDMLKEIDKNDDVAAYDLMLNDSGEIVSVLKKIIGY